MIAAREHFEMSLLGEFLFNPSKVKEAGLEVRDFFYPWNRAVYAAILEGANMATLERKLTEDGTIENLHFVGREKYLPRLLLAAVPPAAEFADMVSALKRYPGGAR